MASMEEEAVPMDLACCYLCKVLEYRGKPNAVLHVHAANKLAQW